MNYHIPVTDFSTEALVLDHRQYRERDLLLEVLSPDHGVIRGVFRRARGGRAPRAAATQILSEVRCDIHQRPSAELADFRDVHVVTSSFPLTARFEATTAAAAVAELLRIFCPPGEPAPRRFRLGIAALTALLDGIEPDGVLAYAQFWMLQLAGLLPPLDRCSSCGTVLRDGAVTSLRDSGFHCADCLPAGHRLANSDLEMLGRWKRRPPSDIEGPVPSALAKWLDDAARDAAEGPLKALTFHRRHSTPGAR